ncbi:MAG: uroporphyrinogen-III decarboxylase-like protein [Planctomycetes bacterium]|nr:uroporphyrinogen-III decarboxylase-like protein [Planctomycetota bacterium]
MPRDVLTPRERWLAVLRREQPDRVPMDYWGTPEATRRLLAHLGCADEWAAFRKLHIDRPVTVQPAYTGPALKPGCDCFGCRRADVRHAGGVYRECVGHPLAEHDTVADVERNYTWPTADWFDYTVLPGQVNGKEEYPIQGGGSEPFLVYTELRGLERAYRDLLTKPELVAYCLDKLFDLVYEQTRRIYETLPGQITISYVAEDFGSQEGLLFSPQIIRTVFIPRMKRMIDLAHQAGVFVFCHSDGAIRPIIPDLVAAGIDVLNPIQWRCPGLDRAELKRDFGDLVVFHGGVDNQQTLAFGTPADVRAEVVANLRVLGARGGYILAPCHNIQAVSPPENVVALYEAGYAHGRV